MKSLFLFLVCSFGFGVFAQFQVGHTTITFNDPARTGGFGSGGGSGRQIQTEIYYPATIAGDNVALVSGQFPVITFGHGFAMSWDAYMNVWQRYAAKGYILAFPRTESGLLPAPSHGDFGTDLRQVSEKMLALNSNASSIFNGKVAQRALIMGHSMGGGATMLASANNSNIVGIVGLAPAETNPEATLAAPNVTVPALIFSGTADGVTPAAEHHTPIYNGLASTCKNFVNIIGGGHCYYAGTNFNCDFGESTSSPDISINRAQQQQLTYTILDPWLDFILNENCTAYASFQTALSATSGINSITNCPSVAPVSISANGAVLSASTTAVSYQWFFNNSPINNSNSQTYTATQDGNYTVEVTYAYGCTTSAPFNYGNGGVGIDENIVAFQLFPNPVTSLLTIKNTSGRLANYSLLDLSGRIIMNFESFDSNVSLDLSGFSKGNYFLNIASFQGKQTHRIVKD
jgi:dienelactone hydrolase